MASESKEVMIQDATEDEFPASLKLIFCEAGFGVLFTTGNFSKVAITCYKAGIERCLTVLEELK